MEDDERDIAVLQHRLRELETLRDRSEGGPEWARRLEEKILLVGSQLTEPTRKSSQHEEDRRATGA